MFRLLLRLPTMCHCNHSKFISDRTLGCKHVWISCWSWSKRNSQNPYQPLSSNQSCWSILYPYAPLLTVTRPYFSIFILATFWSIVGPCWPLFTVIDCYQPLLSIILNLILNFSLHSFGAAGKAKLGILDIAWLWQFRCAAEGVWLWGQHGW